MEPSGLIEQGGPLVWVLLGLAFIGSVCVVERMFFFHRARINVGDLLVGLAHHVRRRSFAEALHEAARAPGPVARVAHAALLRYYLSRADLRDVVQEAGQLEVPRIEKNIRAILGVALLAPLGRDAWHAAWHVGNLPESERARGIHRLRRNLRRACSPR